MAKNKTPSSGAPSVAEMTIAASDVRASLFAGPSFEQEVDAMVDGFGPQSSGVSRFLQEEGVSTKEIDRAVDFLDRKIIKSAPPKGPAKP